jgi:hypothetical protein
VLCGWRVTARRFSEAALPVKPRLLAGVLVILPSSSAGRREVLLSLLFALSGVEPQLDGACGCPTRRWRQSEARAHQLPPAASRSPSLRQSPARSASCAYACAGARNTVASRHIA